MEYLPSLPCGRKTFTAASETQIPKSFFKNNNNNNQVVVAALNVSCDHKNVYAHGHWDAKG